MKVAVASVAVVLCALLTACASHRPVAASSSPADPTTSSSPVAAPSQHVAEASEYADMLSKPIAAFRSEWTTYTNADCANGNHKPTCTQAPLTLNYDALTIVDAIDGAAQPGAVNYIGLPPPQLTKLVGDTRAMAQRVYLDTTNQNQPVSRSRRDILALLHTLDGWAQ